MLGQRLPDGSTAERHGRGQAEESQRALGAAGELYVGHWSLGLATALVSAG